MNWNEERLTVCFDTFGEFKYLKLKYSVLIYNLRSDWLECHEVTNIYEGKMYKWVLMKSKMKKSR